jgi:NADH:ubiquinone oxidoreductase subunit 3 (subunit A)
MKLQFFFILFDVLVILAYPIAFIVHRLRRMKGVK